MDVWLAAGNDGPAVVDPLAVAVVMKHKFDCKPGMGGNFLGLGECKLALTQTRWY